MAKIKFKIFRRKSKKPKSLENPFKSIVRYIKTLYDVLPTKKKRLKDVSVDYTEQETQYRQQAEAQIENEWAKQAVAEDEADIVIENFKSLIIKMQEDDYTLHFNQGFRNTDVRSASGTYAKIGSVNEILNKMDEALMSTDKVIIAKNIEENGKYLEELVETLVFAVYNPKYAKWGGGSGAYSTALLEFLTILTTEKGV